MGKPKVGLYEHLVTEALEEELGQLSSDLVAERARVESAEVSDRVALHVARFLERAIAGVDEKERVAFAVRIARDLIDAVARAASREGEAEERPVQPGETLRWILKRKPDGSPDSLKIPLTPLLDTTILTNAPGEPRVGQQILSEVESADRIDLLVAFIFTTGLRPFRKALERFCASGRPLRILTTTYTQSTQLAALEQLRDLGASIRVSYDTAMTRLHAKAWIFHRESGFSTAFIGSSNLSHSAMATGVEWNVRASGARNPDTIRKMASVFEGYWNGGDFVTFDAEQFQAMTARGASDSGPTIMLSPIELTLWPFQERMLEQVSLARHRGQHRNLLVAATGTGKTVMAAADYARLAGTLNRARLLFVAHREEILTQAMATFRHALRQHDFGELWVGPHRPREFEHVFASIQSLHANGLASLDADHFDVVIVDEFHHATAPTYQTLLDHVQPRELLGLTATPERSDGLDVRGFFGGRIAAELRLWDAIDQQRLTPFAYYGIHDGLDLREIPWRRGRGYDTDKLTNVMTANEVWARLVVRSVLDHVDNPRTFRALGFCVSVDHARFMARVFMAAGLACAAVWGDSSRAERAEALDALRNGKIRVLFSVDLFNEGVDLPDVDTLLMLRPTDSPTLFLQQLGRGLRRAAGKACCTVLDFVGRHRKEFRYDRRFLALFGGSRKELQERVKSGFPLLPAGCHMELDPVAQKIILDNLRQAIPSQWPAKVAELRRMAARGEDPDLAAYLEETGLELEDIYSGNQQRGWGHLRAEAGLPTEAAGPHESSMRTAVGRLLHVDDEERIEFWRRWLAAPQAPALREMPERERRLARMLVAQLGGRALPRDTTLEEGWQILWEHPQVRRETGELLQVLEGRIPHIHHRLETHPAAPLLVHASYTRLEILAAFGSDKKARVTTWQQGVQWIEEAQVDLCAFTLDKTSGAFSPTTRYRDYAISPDLIHWESQNFVRMDSPTGRRYQTHEAKGSTILLFARLRQSDRSFWFLGPATYVEHRGEKPMAITWKLQHRLPGDLFAQFAAA